jgi:hypothetical protein
MRFSMERRIVCGNMITVHTFSIGLHRQMERSSTHALQSLSMLLKSLKPSFHLIRKMGGSGALALAEAKAKG